MRALLAVLTLWLPAFLHADERWRLVLTGTDGAVQVEKFIDTQTLQRKGDLVEVQILDNRGAGAPFVSAVDRYTVNCAAGTILPHGSRQYAGAMATGKVVRTKDYSMGPIKPAQGSGTAIIIKAVCDAGKDQPGARR
jgi:hypothetical protein